MKSVLALSFAYGVVTLSSAFACPGGSAEIALTSDNCNELTGKSYGDCETAKGHAPRFGQLSKLNAFGHGFTIEGRTFQYNPKKKTWCERTSESCLQVFPRQDESTSNSVLVGFCSKENTSADCAVKGLPAKGSARKASSVEIGYIAFSEVSATIIPSHDKEGYAYGPSPDGTMLIEVTATQVGGMFGLRFEAMVYAPTLKTLDQSYELGSNMDQFGNVYRGLPRADESDNSRAASKKFGGAETFQISAGCH